MIIRRLKVSDVPAIMAIQKAAFTPKLWESEDTYLNRIKLFPAGAIGCFSKKMLVGYFIAHPWIQTKYVPLTYTIKKLPKKPNCIYIHDIVIVPSFQGKGIRTKLMRAIFKIGIRMKLTTFCGIAVQKSNYFWNRLGARKIKDVTYGKNEKGIWMLLEK